MSSLGCSTRVAVLFAIVIAIFFVVGLAGGAIGRGLGIDSPSFLHVPPLEIHDFFKGDRIAEVAGFTITNTLIASTLTMIVVLAISVAATRKMRVIPGRLQALVEMGIEMLASFIDGVAGKKYGRKFLPVIATIFIFVMFNAYLAMVPVFGPGFHVTEQATAISSNGGTVEYVTASADVHKGDIIARLDNGDEIVAAITGHVYLDVSVGDVISPGQDVAEIKNEPHLLRSANTDINMTLALAIMAVLFIEFSAFRARGFRHYISEYVNVGEFARGIRMLFSREIAGAPLAIMTGIINMIMGLLEAISHGTRVISFSFRLFGNMTAGEILLLSAAFLIPWVMAIPFYGLEILIGFIQALIFGGLTLVFASVAVAHASEDH